MGKPVFKIIKIIYIHSDSAGLLLDWVDFGNSTVCKVVLGLLLSQLQLFCLTLGRGEDLEWKRPSELVDDPAFFVDGATRFDVKQVG